MERYSSMSRYRSATTRTSVHQATNKPVVRRSSVIVLTHLQPASPRKAQSLKCMAIQVAKEALIGR